MDTSSAEIFMYRGMVITRVDGNERLFEIRKPAIMLPQARRLIGLIRCGSFSLIGEMA